ncbi:titin homolog isoform X2 [Ornithodoros turicata]|uniref:titin homolog isoform X2 n=1 Tax=Ornithodoros turicata TaxID=34597 RepID=UPI0031387543
MGAAGSRLTKSAMHLLEVQHVTAEEPHLTRVHDKDDEAMLHSSRNDESSDNSQSTVRSSDGEPPSIEVTTARSVTLRWTCPDLGFIQVLSFIIEKKDQTDADWVPVAVVDTQVTSYVIENLDLRINHWFRVLARSTVGLRSVLQSAGPVRVIPQDNHVNRPGPPTTPLLVVVTGPFSMDVKWGVPDSDGGCPVLGYIVALKESSRTLWMEVCHVFAPAVKTHIRDLQEGHEYLVRIYAWNDVGVSDPLETPEPTKIVRPTGVVIPPSAPVGPLIVEAVTDNSVCLTWKEPELDGGGTIRNYLIEYRDVSASEIVKSSVRTPDCSTRFTVPDLKGRHFYVFRVCAENEAGTGDALVLKKPIRVQLTPVKPPAPGTPTVTVHPSMPDACIVTWTAPCPDVICYVVERCDLIADIWIMVGQEKDTTFICENLVPGLEYSFRVSAENDAGMGMASPPSLPIVITRKVASMTAPHFTRELSDCTVLVDNDAKFDCEFTGIPTPEITWYKGGQEIFETRRAEIDISNSSSTLVLRKIRLEDRGKVECQALNNAGLSISHARLEVHAPPKIIASSSYRDGLMFDCGETVRIKLSYTGFPPPAFVWSRDGKPVTFDASTTQILDRDDQTVHLKIVDVDKRQGGTYSIEATNQHGRDDFSVKVTVTGEPEPPLGKPTVTAADWNSCNLSWDPPAVDGGSPISSYIVERKEVNTDLWLKATSTHHEECTVYGLMEGVKYVFRVKAVNAYGTSKPSEVSDAVRIPKLSSRASAATEDISKVQSSEATEAIASEFNEETLVGSEGDISSTVSEYGSDDQRSSLDVDEFIAEDIELTNVESQVSIPGLCSEWSDYDTFITSSGVKYGSVDASELDYDKVGKNEVEDQERMEGEQLETGPVPPVVPHVGKDIGIEQFAMPTCQHSYDMVTDAVEHVVDLSVEPWPLEDASVSVTTQDTAISALAVVPCEAVQELAVCIYPEHTADLQVVLNPSLPITSAPPMPLEEAVPVRGTTVPTKAIQPTVDVSPEKDGVEVFRVKRTSPPKVNGVKPAAQRGGHARVKPVTEQPAQSSSGIESMSEVSTAEEEIRKIPESEHLTREAQLKGDRPRTPVTATTRKLIRFSKRVERDYSAKLRKIDRLEQSIHREMSSIEHDLALLRAIQRQLLREIDQLDAQVEAEDEPSEGRGRHTRSEGRSGRRRTTEGPRRIVYPSMRFYESDSDEDEPEMTVPRPRAAPKGEAPRFVSKLENRIIPCGYRVKLHCTVMGDPEPEVTWMKNGRKLAATNRRITVTKFDYGLCTLEIYNVKHEDTGEYICMAMNPFGKATTCAYLRVAGYREPSPKEPKFDSCPSDVTANAGGTAVFVWEFSGCPSPTIKVLKDSKLLRTDLKREVLVSRDGICRVTVQDIDDSDAGVYSCVAENESGSTSSTCMLVLTGQDHVKEKYEKERAAIQQRQKEEEKEAEEAMERAKEVQTNPLIPMSRPGDYYPPRRNFRTYGARDLDALEDIPRTRSHRVPGPPLDPVVTERGPTWATLAWTRPIDDGGEAISAYRIHFRETPSKVWREKGVCRICVFDVYGLKPNTDYVFQVSAKNKNGWSQSAVAVPQLANWSFS